MKINPEKNFIECLLHGDAKPLGNDRVGIVLSDLGKKKFLLVNISPHLMSEYYTLFEDGAVLNVQSINDLLIKEYKRPERGIKHLIIEDAGYVRAKFVFENGEKIQVQPDDAIYMAVKGGLKILVESSLLDEVEENISPIKSKKLNGKMEKRLLSMPGDFNVVSTSCGGWGCLKKD